MLLPTITRAFHAAQGRLDVDPYAAWATAIRQIRIDCERGNHPGARRLRDYLDGVPDEQQSEVLQDLIAEDLRFAWQAGKGTCLETYLSEFGDEFSALASVAVVPADLVEDEFLARYAVPNGDAPSVDEYEKRFPRRPDVMELLRRRCLHGERYIKIQKCGEGAMGEVHEAYDHHLSRFVAIKQPREGLVQNAELLHHFAEEARVTAALEHPAIVCVHEHYHDDDAPFYVMRLVRGQTLSERIADYHHPPIDRARGEQRLIWNQLLQAFATVCDAMAYAHVRGVLHRDLKPGNIVIGQFGEVAILDWGMAMRMPPAASCTLGAVSAPPDYPRAGEIAAGTSETSKSVVAGTPQYMPPEQADGIADACSDVFGLGAVLYEMLTAGPPHAWPEDSLPADWRRIVRDAQFPPPRRLNPRFSRALEAICLGALARNRADRYQSPAELAQEVRRYLAGEPLAARAEPFLVKGWRLLRRLCP